MFSLISDSASLLYLNITCTFTFNRLHHDSALTAGDVYVLIGSPPVFHLRCGWFGKGEESKNINNGIGRSVGKGFSTLEWVGSLTNISVDDSMNLSQPEIM
ncbi:unnamed protein product [Lactuca virosa]|uniref:Uncharacterized protein n=1 Tax=Lactuca virosa TaxID=75947 RepID=A0AAU9MN81_9ASTR|nr:unnamed protein product [Lactuca virosa]